MVTASKDSYKRVYRDDGSFHYPKIPANLLRNKGDLYFKTVKLTCSLEGTQSNPTMSLLKVYQEQIIPALESKVVDQLLENNTVKICIVKQEDGAGLHTNKRYIQTMQDKFNKRDWLLFNQPSQSPITNVHDACIFPMMSKAVSREQAVVFGCRLLRGEQLYNSVMKVWEEKKSCLDGACLHGTPSNCMRDPRRKWQ
jgi:hypothetical protein